MAQMLGRLKFDASIPLHQNLSFNLSFLFSFFDPYRSIPRLNVCLRSAASPPCILFDDFRFWY